MSNLALKNPTILEALKKARDFLEALGYGEGGDIHDDLAIAIRQLRTRHRKVADEELS